MFTSSFQFGQSDRNYCSLPISRYNDYSMESKPKHSIHFRDAKAMEMFYQKKEYHKEEVVRAITRAQRIIQNDIKSPELT